MSEFTPPGGEPPPPERQPDPWRAAYPSYGGQGPYDTTREAFARAETSRKMAGWALGLSLVLCLHPITLLVSAGLAIAVLVRAGDGRDHGRGKAIAALVIDAVWVLVVIVLVITGVVREFTQDAERDENGRVSEPSDISTFKLRVGDCLNDPALAGGTAETTLEVEAVPCSQAHQYEVYHEFELPDGDYPGEDEITRISDRECGRRALTFVGTRRPAPSLVVGYYAPQERGWRLVDDREVTCVIGDEKRLTTGTLRGSDR